MNTTGGSEDEAPSPINVAKMEKKCIIVSRYIIMA